MRMKQGRPRRRIRWRVLLGILLVATAAGALVTAARVTTPRGSAYVAQPMTIQHSRDEYAQSLYYYLVPAAPAQVKAALQSELEREGYAWDDDSAPLHRLSAYWVDITARHRPDIRQALLDAHGLVSTPVLDEALAEGVITAGEKTQFGHALAQQEAFEDETVERVPFFDQRIERWRFHRSRGYLARYDDEAGLMDVAPMFHQGPMTLVWFAGTKTVKRYHPHLLGCMTGVGCFPAPGIDTKDEAVMYVDGALDERIHAIASGLHALDRRTADEALRDFLRSGEDEAEAPPLRESASVPATALAAYDLPADESELRRYDDGGWRLLALPDGSVLAAGLQSRRYVLRDGKLERHDEATVFGADGGVRIDAQGTVWGFTWQDATDGPLLVRWPAGQPAQRFPVPYQMQDWTLVPGRGIALREGDDKLHVLDAQTGRWSDAHWNDKLRRQVSDSLDQVLPWSRGAVPIHFRDDLLWDGDRDLYGVSPLTGKVAAAAPLNKRSHRMISPFFGSREAGWVIAITDASRGREVYRLFDLTTGEARVDLLADSVRYPASVARTAHGRLLATTGGATEGTPVAVFDTRTGQALANLAPPAGYAAVAAAFSWSGDGLWVYLQESGPDSRRKLAWWPVPEAYRDAASGESVPDQLRCERPFDACKL